jgi:hypothetical protein
MKTHLATPILVIWVVCALIYRHIKALIKPNQEEVGKQTPLSYLSKYITTGLSTSLGVYV